MPGWHAYAPKLDRAWPWSDVSAVRMRAIGVMMMNHQSERVKAISGSPDEDVGHAAAVPTTRSCGSLSSMGPAASMTRARAASAEWKAVRPADQEAHLGVEPFNPPVADSVLDGVEDQVPSLAHSSGP